MASDGADREDEDISLWRTMLETAQLLPGAGFAQRQLIRVETAMLRELKTRMARLDPATHRADTMDYARDPGASALAARMNQLLDRAAEQSQDQALDDLFHRIIGVIVPDEARILSALSEGQTFPLVHVATGPRVGPVNRRLATNWSTIGKSAGVKLLDQVPAYIAHLRALGLVKSAPEDKTQDIKYQIIESDRTMEQLIEQAQLGRGASIRFIRRSLRLSELGQQFWQACRPG